MQSNTKRIEVGDRAFVQSRGTYGTYGEVENVGPKLVHIRTVNGLRKVHKRCLTWAGPWSRGDTCHWHEDSVCHTPAWVV